MTNVKVHVLVIEFCIILIKLDCIIGTLIIMLEVVIKHIFLINVMIILLGHMLYITMQSCRKVLLVLLMWIKVLLLILNMQEIHMLVSNIHMLLLLIIIGVSRQLVLIWFNLVSCAW